MSAAPQLDLEPEIDISALLDLPKRERDEFLSTLGDGQVRAFRDELADFGKYWARPDQQWPAGEWSVWLMNAGRAAGKTFAGANHTHRWARDHPNQRIALVARTAGDARDTMVEGISGLMRTGYPSFRPHYEPSKRRVTWPNGTYATIFTGEEPDALRGPEVAFYWADELASWKYLAETWDNLQFAARGGDDPRGIVTTTPRPLRFYRELMAEATTVVTRASTYDNAVNLPPRFLSKLLQKYEGTSKGRQELHAELLEQSDKAVWQRRWIDPYRIDSIDQFDRIVVAIDPAVTANETSDETGIVVAGAIYFPDRLPHFYVLADLSGRYTAGEWATKACVAFDIARADLVVGEVNNGGDLVERNIRTVRRDLPYKSVNASRGKHIRAEPIASMYEQGRVHHIRRVLPIAARDPDEFPALTQLEDQMCTWEPNSGADSPDRMDALVFALTELAGDQADPVLSFGDSGALDTKSTWS